MKFNSLLLIFLMFLGRGLAQDTTAQVDKKKLNRLIVVSSVTYGVSLVALNYLWYDDAEKQSFQFFNDNDEWKQVDKLGHFYAAFHLSAVTSHALQRCNVPVRKSDMVAAITGFALLVPIEIFDGFSDAYGASGGDLLADAGGALFYLGQKRLWNEIRIHPKFSFQRTDYAPQRPNVLGDGLASEMLKDYNGQTEWISFDMDKFSRFPKWLNLAVGYGVDGMIYANNQANFQTGLTPKRQFYVALDFDLNAFHSKSKLINTIIYFVNMIKLPAPALEFSSGGIKGHYLYF